MTKYKKPGEFKNQKARYKVRQALYDSIRNARNIGVSQVTVNQKHYELWYPTANICSSQLAIVKFKKTLEFVILTDKDGLWANILSSGQSRRIQWKEILVFARVIPALST